MPDKAPSQPLDGTSEAITVSEPTDTSIDTPGLENGREHQKDSEIFSRDYVESLRAEAKENRQKASKVDFILTECRRLAVREATRGILTDPEALAWSDDWTDAETGLPDHDRITAAAEALALEKPWVARPRGNVHQGEHGTGDQALSLSALLRS